MKKLIVALALLLASTTNVFAGGDVYFGKYVASNQTVSPFSELKAEFVSGVYLDKTVKLDTAYYVKPWLRLETYMDKYNGNFSFHPSSIKYDLGVTVGNVNGLYADVSRMCWHSIDAKERTSQYFLLKVGYRW